MVTSRKTTHYGEGLPTIGGPHWHDKSIDVRLKYMKELIVPHPGFTEAREEIEARAEICVASGCGEGVPLVANTGAGKSTLCRALQQRWADVVQPERTIRQVIVVTMPEVMNVPRMAQAILKATKSPLWEKGNAKIWTERLYDNLPRLGTRIILYDNAHDIPERRGFAGVRDIGNYLRDFIDAVPALHVFLGTEAVIPLTDLNPQLRGRTLGRIDLPYFEVHTKERLSEFMRFLAEVDKSLPLAETSGLGLNNRAQRLGYASRGISRALMKLIGRAMRIAVAAGRERISDSDLLAAFDQLYPQAVRINPFRPDAPLRYLDQLNEPFANWNEGLDQLRKRGRKF